MPQFLGPGPGEVPVDQPRRAFNDREGAIVLVFEPAAMQAPWTCSE